MNHKRLLIIVATIEDVFKCIHCLHFLISKRLLVCCFVYANSFSVGNRGENGENGLFDRSMGAKGVSPCQQKLRQRAFGVFPRLGTFVPRPGTNVPGRGNDLECRSFVVSRYCYSMNWCRQLPTLNRVAYT